MTDQPIHDAATVILWRQGDQPEVLMGLRGKGAVFMPDRYVFPGGRVDAADAETGLVADLPEVCRTKLEQDAPGRADALAMAAIREVREETGLSLSRLGTMPTPVPEGWEDFATRGVIPDASALRFFFRAVTPPGRTRRFDARFFLAPAEAATGDAETFAEAGGELSHLHWVALPDARNLRLPFVTSIVLAELQAHLADPDLPRPVPFFDNRQETPRFLAL
ncbi:NUDIX hydrolase [Halovulum sp. GXIMD14793]